MELITKPRKWGNSLAVILPKNIVESQKISKNVEIQIEIKKQRPTGRKLFGMCKDWKKPTQQIKNEMKEGWE